jgi:hypothetical protein
MTRKTRCRQFRIILVSEPDLRTPDQQLSRLAGRPSPPNIV